MTMISGFEDEKFKIVDIGRVTQFSKKQNEQNISDLNLVKNATIYRNQKEKETGIDCVTEKMDMRDGYPKIWRYFFNIQGKCANYLI